MSRDRRVEDVDARSRRVEDVDAEDIENTEEIEDVIRRECTFYANAANNSDDIRNGSKGGTNL